MKGSERVANRAIDIHDDKLSDLHARVTEHGEDVMSASLAISQEKAPGDDGYVRPGRLRELYAVWSVLAESASD